jgi:hypothetical protein
MRRSSSWFRIFERWIVTRHGTAGC